MISVQFVPGPGFDALVERLAGAIAGEAARIALVADEAGQLAVTALQTEVPYDGAAPDPHMRDQFRVEIVGGNPATVRVMNDSAHRDYVVFGHGDIYPVNAKALRFEGNGQVVFARHVGPVGPNDYPSRALADLAPELQSVAEAAAARRAAERVG